MAAVTPGQQIARVLKREGVEVVFTLTGGHIVPLHQGCIEEGIRIIDTRHEQAAVNAAEGYAMATGKPGVVALTAGPGVANGVPGVAVAYTSRSPVLVIGGRSPFAMFDKEALQDFDQLSMMRSITKWARGIYQPERAAEYTGMAFRQMLDGEPGPVFLEVPLDIIGKEVDESTVTAHENYRTSVRAAGDPEAVARAIDILSKAERPVIVAGDGVHWSQAHGELQQFVEQSKIPTFTFAFGRGQLPDDHELCFGAPFFLAIDTDVILALGVRWDWRVGFGQFGPAGSRKVIQVDVSSRAIGMNRPIDIGIVGDPRLVLKQLSDGFPARAAESPWPNTLRQRVQGWEQRLDAIAATEGQYMHPIRLAREVASFASRDRNTTVIADGGDIAAYGYFCFRAYQPGHAMATTITPMGNIGAGLPTALAAQAARPDKPVIVLTGDGSFGFNAMEMDTALRHDMPIVCVIGNDRGWGNIRWAWKKRRPDGFTTAIELGFRPYERIVEGMGGYGERVECAAEIRPALERAFASGKAACLNVITDPNPAQSPYEIIPMGGY